MSEFEHLRLACAMVALKADGQPTGQALQGLDREQLAMVAQAAVHLAWLLSEGHALAEIREQIGFTRSP